jgi:CxC2 like cysteine cluster associated with KDZ transposases
MSGIHLVNIQFCQCHQIVGGSLPRIQLLRFKWFPTSLTRPCTAFTFDVLDTFHLLTLQGKLSAYDFYRSLLYKTDGTGICMLKVSIAIYFFLCLSDNIQDRYKSLLFVSRIYRHLKLLQRTGRGHDPAGVIATSPGQCAIECPACPHPDRNLPPDWAQVRQDKG